LHRRRFRARLAPRLDVLHLRPERGGIGLEIERQAVLVEGFLVEAALRLLARGDGVRLGRAQLRALEALAGGQVVGVLLDRPRVLEHRAVIVLAALGLLAGPEGPRGGAGREEGGGDERGCASPPHPATTSTPRGTSNRKMPSGRPTFSLRSSNSNRSRLPWTSSPSTARMRSASSPP